MRVSKRFLAVSATALSGLLVMPAALAVPSDDDIASVEEEAESTRSDISALEVDLARSRADYDTANMRVSIAAEEYNTAQEDLEEAEEQEQEAQDELTEALVDLDEARSLVGGIAMSAYRNGGNFSQLSMFLEADGIASAVSTANTYSMLGTHADSAQQQLDAATVAADLAQTKAAEAVETKEKAADELHTAHAQTQLEAEAAEQELSEITAQQDELITELARLRGVSEEMERERQDHIEEQRQERENREARERAEEEAEREREQADEGSTPSPEPSPSPSSEPSESPSSTPSPRPSQTSSPSPSPSPTSTPSPTPTSTPSPSPTKTPKPKPPKPSKPSNPPSSSAGQKALSWAKTQIGKPYVWGSAGPNSYDCSGLTSAAFQQAGVSIPRNSAAQYNAGTKVALDNLKAGDLIFYSNNGGPSGIYHVGFYAGNGMRLHAPSPGKTVELVPMWYQNIMPYGVRV